MLNRSADIPNGFCGPLLEGRVVLITGGGSEHGIGRAIARLFVAHGAKVAVTDVDGASASKVAAELGPRHIGLECDIADEAQCGSAVAATVEKLGAIDVLINNAGYGTRRPFLDISVKEFEDMLRVNSFGTFLMTRAVLPGMVKRGLGNIVFISSTAAQRGGGGYGSAHYVASKAAMSGFTQAIAREFAGKGIRANVLAPNLISTDGSKEMTLEQRAALEKFVPMQRSGTNWEVAGAALYLASDLSTYVTGATLDVNGGFNIR